jgi:hypothetical protein
MEAAEKLDFGARLAVLGVLIGLPGTLAAMALPFAYPDLPIWAWRAIFWPCFLIMCAAVAFLAFDLISKRLLVSSIWPPGDKVRRVIGIAILCVIFGGGYVLSRVYPGAAPAPPPPMAGADLQSRANKFIFACPKPPRTDQRSRDEIMAELRNNVKALGDTFGVEITIDDIPQGFRMNVAPASPESAIKLGGMASHFEFRGVGQQILIATLIDFPFPLSLVASLMPIDPKSEQSLKLRKNVETMVGARQGACQFL